MYKSATKNRALLREQLAPWLLQGCAMIGLAALLYPNAAHWISTQAQNSEISGYVHEIEKTPDEILIEEREQAEEFNSDIPVGLIQDPYSQQSAHGTGVETEYSKYLEQLDVGESSSFGELVYPDVGVSLPIYHGTTDEVLRKGVGHVYGSSLPVGGQSSHAVLTSHSGLANSTLFTPILDAEVGDIFTVSTLGESAYYEVKSLETVTPERVESLKIIDGEDWVTLITCTPTGVNSHRFLVHAQRIAAPVTESDVIVPGNGQNAGFPWWILIFVAGSGIVAYLVFALPVRRQRGGRHRTSKSTHSWTGDRN